MRICANTLVRIILYGCRYIATILLTPMLRKLSIYEELGRYNSESGQRFLTLSCTVIVCACAVHTMNIGSRPRPQVRAVFI